MIGSRYKHLILAIFVAALLFPVVFSSAQEGGTPGGSILQTQGLGFYKDDDGREHRTASEIVTILIQTVTLLHVTPNETEPSAQVQHHQEFIRLFQICNGGNDSERVIISKIEVSSPARIVSLYFDTDGSGTVSSSDVDVRVGETLSPNLQPGGCIGVLVIVNSEGFPPRTNLQIRLTARSTTSAAANGIQEATGQIVNAVTSSLTSPVDDPPLLLVNGLKQTVATANQVLDYSLALHNSGEGPAQGIVFINDLTEGLEYMPGTLKLDGKLLADVLPAGEVSPSSSRVQANIASLAPGQSALVEYQARVRGGVTRGQALVDDGIVSVENFAPLKTTETVVLIDPFGVVFAAHGGSSTPIPGASVSLLTDTSSNTLLSIPPGAGLPPNTQNLNPATADGQGRYNFTLLPEQLGSMSAAATYYLRASAPGFMNRMLKVSLSATHSGLFQATITAIDGQAIAEANGFGLVREAVTAEDLGSLSPNIPMFETHSLGIDKAVDKQRAEIGDVLTYTINIHNPTTGTISNLILRDTLPQSFHYAAGTARVQKGHSTSTNGVLTIEAQPTIVNDELTINLGELTPSGQTQVKYRVRIGANAHEGEQFNKAVATGRFLDGELVQTDIARVSVYVGAGVFSTRQIILGRVYEDLNYNDRFDKEDRPIAGARVYLMNGQYVLTDALGLYNFPMVGDGAVVIALDPVSVSPGLKLRDQGQLSGRSWARLLRTPLGGGSLLHQDFALALRSSTTPSGKPPATASLIETRKTALAQTPNQIALPTPGLKEQDKPRGAGTYEIASGEKVAPVKPGCALILSPASSSAVVSSGSEVQARVAINWKVLLEINGKPISDKNIGETRVDHANQITTYTFAGLTLPPGPNEIRVTPIGPKNEPGTPVELKVMGRGPVRRIEILTELHELTAGGKDSMLATIRAWDQWENPALDGLVAIEATNVLVMPVDGVPRPDPMTPQPDSNLPTLDRNGRDFERQPPATARQVNDLRSLMSIALKGGEARIKLMAPGIATSAHLKVIMLQAVGELDVRILAETRPTLLVGLAEMSFGNVPGVGINEGMNGETARYRNRLAFFFRGTIRAKNILTLSYDSMRPLNRTAGQDRLFQLDPLERAYPVFGDSSTRFEEAQSNSKLYARLDRERSYAIFGDFDADMNGLALAGYSRKLTGVKLHLEDRGGSFITITGARPGTAFARDVIPGGSLSLVQLSYGEILAGSESVTLEVRDRRNPEIILSSEPLIRSVDYNLDAVTGQIFFLRFISTFDYSLNLTQVVVTYEHRANGLNSIVLTGRALKKFPGLGLQLGLSGINQRQDQFSEFRLGGLDAQQRLPHGGLIKAAGIWSRGGIDGFGSSSSVSGVSGQSVEHNGFAYEIDYNQPVSFREGVLHGRLAAASPGFLNPFGTTVTPGSRRAEFAFAFKLRPSSTARLAFINERNQTERVDNSRSTFSFAWSEAIRDNLKLNFGYDFRKFSDNKSDRDITSNLFTIGAEWRATKKLELTVKREQNLGSSDPTYPNQTTLGANYQLNDWAKLFFTQRLASAPIVPIADTTSTGFSFSSTRSEMAFGIETKLSRFTSMTGRYQVDDGANTTDSFAVIGLINRLPISKQLSLELGYERGFHLKGLGKNFNSITLGAAWQPKENFISNFRYELRDRNGLEHLFVIGAAGRINDSITALSRFQFARTKLSGQQTSFAEGMAAVAVRPATNDRMGLLISYTRRSRETAAATSLGPTRDRLDSLSTDAFYQLTPRLEFSGRLAARLNANGQDQTPYVSTLTYLTQGRVQYRFAKQFDLAAEMRALIQAGSGTAKRSYGTELGYWPLPDLRLGLGYNFTSATEPQGSIVGGARHGFYFNISTKLSNFFDLFGTSRKDLTSGPGQTTTSEAPVRSELKEGPK
jgi:uncharacterized repeat protein (TIGR01451 family)